jgi:hypothetical protein
MIKVRAWELTLITRLVIPLLKKITFELKARAEETDTQIDDMAIGFLETVIDFLSTDGLIETT